MGLVRAIYILVVPVILDEDNWRNDYPDEEESPHSSDSESGRYWKGHGVDGVCKYTVTML